MADKNVKPGEPHWRKSNPPLRNNTRAAPEPDTPCLYGWIHQMMKILQIEAKPLSIQEEWTAQVRNIRETVAAEAAKANKDGDDGIDKSGSKHTKPKSKQTTHSSNQEEREGLIIKED